MIELSPGRRSKVQEGVAHLRALTPLHARQAALPPDIRRVHLTVLNCLLEESRIPRDTELQACGAELDVASALQRLSTDDLVILDTRGEPVGAYPVTLAATPHRVCSGGQSIFAMCALDALAVAPMTGRTTRIASVCALTDQSIAIEQAPDETPTDDGMAVQVGIEWREPQGHAAHSLCRNMVFLGGAQVARRWHEAGSARETFALDEAAVFASEYFMPLMRDAAAE